MTTIRTKKVGLADVGWKRGQILWRNQWAGSNYGRPKFSFDLRHIRSEPRESLVKERRLTARIEAPFLTRLKGVDSTGRVFTEHSVLDNVSNGGLHMCIMRGIPLGVEVTVAVRLSADAGFAPVLRLAARGHSGPHGTQAGWFLGRCG